MNSLQRHPLLYLFLLGCLVSLITGFLIGRPQAPLDLQCGGRSALLLPGENHQQWMLLRYDLDLRKEGLGDIKARLRLLDAERSENLGYQHRTSSFSYRRQDQRLLLQIKDNGIGQTSNLPTVQLAGLGLFAFSQHQLSYQMRQIDPANLLIETGQGGMLFCVHNLSGN
ncbi:hypothetical protein [Pseudomonas sp. C9-3]|uniref:hypothetical protein n=1 Tax=Pseudomonas sp. C9-3 TaxID=3078264 RepID=UPI0028EA0832|nr:hypothetical protein [Pseudomonas sp. C9-3]